MDVLDFKQHASDDNVNSLWGVSLKICGTATVNSVILTWFYKLSGLNSVQEENTYCCLSGDTIV